MNTWYKSLFIVFILKKGLGACSSKCPLNTHFYSFSILKVGLNFGIYGSGKKSGAKVSGVRTIEADGIKGLS